MIIFCSIPSGLMVFFITFHPQVYSQLFIFKGVREIATLSSPVVIYINPFQGFIHYFFSLPKVKIPKD